MAAEARRGQAIFLLILATAGWGLSFPCGKAFLLAAEPRLSGYSSWALSALLLGVRFGVATLLLAAFQLPALRRITPGEWRQGLLLGATGGMGMFFQVDALRYTHASTVAFLTNFTCVLIPLTVLLRKRRLPPPRTLLCLALVFPGVGILAQFDWHTWRLGRGELETLIASCFFTGEIFALEPAVFRSNDSQRVTLVMFGTITAVLAPFFLHALRSVGDLAVIAANGPMLAVFLVLAIVCSIFAFSIMNHWQPHVSPTTAGILYCLEPLFTTLFALFLPALLATFLGVEYANETITPHLFLGGLLIVAANVLIALGGKRDW